MTNIARKLVSWVGNLFVTRSRQRQRPNAHDRDDATEVKSWENEGGNLAPIPVATVHP
jgi:hypothetical protein